MPVSIRWPVTVTTAEWGRGLTTRTLLQWSSSGRHRDLVPSRQRRAAASPLRGTLRAPLATTPRPGAVPTAPSRCVAAARNPPGPTRNDTATRCRPDSVEPLRGTLRAPLATTPRPGAVPTASSRCVAATRNPPGPTRDDMASGSSDDGAVVPVVDRALPHPGHQHEDAAADRRD